MSTKIMLSQLRLLQPLYPFFAMKQPRHTLPVLSRSLSFNIALRNASLFSTRSHKLRASSKSLVDDEAELSDWVDDIRTGRFDDPAKNSRFGQRFGRDEDEDEDYGEGRKEFRSQRNDNNSNRVSSLGKRRGEDFQRGKNPNGNVRRRFESRNGEGEVKGRNFKGGGGGGVGRFHGEDDGFGSRRNNNNNVNNRASSFGKTRGGDFQRGKNPNANEGRRFQSTNDEGEVKGRNFKGGRGRSVQKFITEDEDDEDDEEDEEEFASRWNNRASSMGKGRGENLRRGGNRNANARGRFQLRDDDEEVEGVKFEGVGGVVDFLTEDDDEEENGDASEDEEILNKSRTALFGQQNASKSTPRPSSSGGTDSYLSETRFDQCSVSPLSLKGVKDAGYEKMTVVQEATLPVILKGKDVLAKAKTGTGKTVAFLLPSIEVVAKSPPTDRDQKRPPIHVLVICPTRELASQAAAEATKLLKYHSTIGVQVVIGGTRLALEQKRMQANPCQILVATPGRLRDHIENTAGFATRLMGVKVLVLDEADHLLDMGFRKDIEKIIAAVPKQRQTLMFSATIPEEVRQVCHIALRRDHEFINTVEEGTEETHSQVRQMHLVSPLEKHFSLLYVLLKEHIANDVDYKVLVFCTTAMVTRLVAELLGELNMNVREIHSRKPQSYRTRVSEEFRKSKGLILVTSDVSARGVDYPDVTLVVQVGLPADRQQYIHRLGRTGRKGKEGQGILLLAPWEDFFLSTIKDLPIEKAPEPSVDPDTKKKVEKALSQVEMKNKEAAYQAWLGYYNSNKKVGKDKYRLVELANEFSRTMGLANPPAIPKLVLGKMGLRNIPGLRSK